MTRDDTGCEDCGPIRVAGRIWGQPRRPEDIQSIPDEHSFRDTCDCCLEARQLTAIVTNPDGVTFEGDVCSDCVERLLGSQPWGERSQHAEEIAREIESAVRELTGELTGDA